MSLPSPAVNLLGVVEHPELPPMTSYRVDADGRPYVPTGDAGVVLGVALGDSVFATDTDHVAPGVTLVHPDPAARYALTTYACVGNDVVVRTGAAVGATGWVVGKRGEAGRVIARFADDVMALMRPGDQVSVRAHGQGYQAELGGGPAQMLNLDPRLPDMLPIQGRPDGVDVTVAVVMPSRLCGNGIGRPAQAWDVDLALAPDDLHDQGDLRLGDIVALTDLDVRHNMGFRRGWVTVGIVCHGSSPMPGHGPGVTPILTGAADAVRAVAATSPRPGLTDTLLRSLARPAEPGR